MKKISYFLVGLVLTAACKTSQPQATAPAASYTPTPQTVREISTVNVPLEVPLTEVEKQINVHLVNPLYEDSQLEDDNVMLKVNKRANIRIEPRNDAFNIVVPVHIWAKAGYKVEKFGVNLSQYKDTEFDIDINFLTKINLDRDWNVISQTVPNGYTWITRPSVNVAGFNIPITAIVEEVLDKQLGEVAKIIDTEVKKNIVIKPYMLDAWKNMQAPVQLNEEYNVWLKVTPVELSMTPPVSRGKNVRMAVGLRAHTETFIGKKPDVVINNVLPPLTLAPSMTEQFQVGLVGEISFAKAKELAMKHMAGQEYKFNDDKYSVQIVDMDIYGQGENIIVMVDMTGDFKGKVYLRGKPAFDVNSSSIILQNLDYDLATKNKLIKVADWLAHGKFLKKIEPYFTMSIASQLDEAKKMIQQNLANNKVNDKISIKGQLDQLTPNAIHLTSDAIQAVVLAKGKIEVMVAGF